MEQFSLPYCKFEIGTPRPRRRARSARRPRPASTSRRTRSSDALGRRPAAGIPARRAGAGSAARLGPAPPDHVAASAASSKTAPTGLTPSHAATIAATTSSISPSRHSPAVWRSRRSATDQPPGPSADGVARSSRMTSGATRRTAEQRVAGVGLEEVGQLEHRPEMVAAGHREVLRRLLGAEPRGRPSPRLRIVIRPKPIGLDRHVPRSRHPFLVLGAPSAPAARSGAASSPCAPRVRASRARAPAHRNRCPRTRRAAGRASPHPSRAPTTPGAGSGRPAEVGGR